MIKAINTVMNETLIQVWCLEFVQPGELDLNAKLKEFAQAQADISLKAGRREVVEDYRQLDRPTLSVEGKAELLNKLQIKWQAEGANDGATTNRLSRDN